MEEYDKIINPKVDDYIITTTSQDMIDIENDEPGL